MFELNKKKQQKIKEKCKKSSECMRNDKQRPNQYAWHDENETKNARAWNKNWNGDTFIGMCINPKKWNNSTYQTLQFSANSSNHNIKSPEKFIDKM